MKKSINILGVTGSVGQSAVSIVRHNAKQFDVGVISANKNAKGLADAAIMLGASDVVLVDEGGRDDLYIALKNTDVAIHIGADALIEKAGTQADISLSAILGMAGLMPTVAAIKNSAGVAIANKEPIVGAGPQIMALAKSCGTKILPVDSEHNAIFQVFNEARRADITRLLLTASGGPFRKWNIEDIKKATPAQAVAHPNWDMGRHISVDSASMMNKAREVIEAHYLFDIAPEQIEVVVHPQSVIYSMVEYCDGSILAQMGASDMRVPLANVLAWPELAAYNGTRLDFKALRDLSFEAPDVQKFPAISLAYRCIKLGQWACITMNAANEVAVDVFLDEKRVPERALPFTDIIKTVEHIIEDYEAKQDQKEHMTRHDFDSFEDIIDFDTQIREKTLDYINHQR